MTQVADAFTPRICSSSRRLQVLHTNKVHHMNSKYDSRACVLLGVTPGLEIPSILSEQFIWKKEVLFYMLPSRISGQSTKKGSPL